MIKIQKTAKSVLTILSISSVLQYFIRPMLAVNCPSNNELWMEAGRKLNCDPNVNGTYHCILTIKNTSMETVEICLSPSVVDSNEAGCPKVVFLNGKPYLSKPFIDCKPNWTKCPGRIHRIYYTDQLYEFPDCILIGSEEETLTEVQSVPHHTSTTSATTSDNTTQAHEDTSVQKPATPCLITVDESHSIEITTLFFVLTFFTVYILLNLKIIRRKIKECLRRVRSNAHHKEDFEKQREERRGKGSTESSTMLEGHV